MTFAAIDEIVMEEIGRRRVIGEDATHLGGRQEDDVGLGPRHPLPDRVLLAQIEFVTVDRQHLHVFLGEPTQEGRADHAAMPGDPNATLSPGERRLFVMNPSSRAAARLRHFEVARDHVGDELRESGRVLPTEGS